MQFDVIIEIRPTNLVRTEELAINPFTSISSNRRKTRTTVSDDGYSITLMASGLGLGIPSNDAEATGGYELVDYPAANDVFLVLRSRLVFVTSLWDSEHDGDCKMNYYRGGEAIARWPATG